MTQNEIIATMKLQRSRDVLDADMNGETIMMDIDKGVYFGLNGTASSIWAALEAPATLVEIIDHVRQSFTGTAVGDLDAEITSFVTDLYQKGLVVQAS